MIRYLRQPPVLQNLGTASNVTATVLGTTLQLTNLTNSTSTSTGALVVAGGVGIGGDLYAANIVATTVSGTITTADQPQITTIGVQSALTAVDLTVTGNLVIAGNVISVEAENSSVANAIIELHTTGTPLTVDDGKDIGLEFNYYKSAVGAAQTAYLVWDNASGYLKFISNGTVSAGGVVSGSLGTFQTGNLRIESNTAATSTTTGAVLIAGGAGIAGNLYAGGI